jgi:CheY-like chemotaxis protein
LLEKGETFDVMLCDLMMPEMSGMDLHALVAKKWPDLARKTAVLSGGAFSERAQSFIETSGLKCLDKPFSIRELVDAVTRLAAS